MSATTTHDTCTLDWCDGQHMPGEGHASPIIGLHGVILARTTDEHDQPTIRLGLADAIPDWDTILTPEQLAAVCKLGLRLARAARRDHNRGNWTRKLRALRPTRLGHWRDPQSRGAWQS